MNIEKIRIATPDGTLFITEIKDGVAYDQNHKPIPQRAFRFQMQVLSKDWTREVSKSDSILA